MKYLLFTVAFLAINISTFAQDSNWQQYEPSPENPYGLRNPDTPDQLDDFAPMIGTCDCYVEKRNPDGTWQDRTAAIWSFKYIMNGTAIQDEIWHDGIYATSIRQFHTDSLLWVVPYMSFPGVTTTPSTWLGKKEGEDIVLEVPRKSPGGMDGISRLTFSNISSEGFEWRGEWVNEAQKIVYPFRRISCKKRVIPAKDQ